MHMMKTYKMFLALVLCAFGAISVSAGDRVVLTNDMFYNYAEGQWGADAQKVGKLFTESNENKPGELGVASGCPFGDTNCNAWIDLSEYSKLYVKMAGCDADGNLNDTNPRLFINRTAKDGVYNQDKAQSNCLIVPCTGWGEAFYTKEDDGTYVIDLTEVKKEWGYAHLHAIKGSAWNTKAIVYSVEAEKASEAEMVGWVSIINNGDLEGEDVSSFFFVENAPTNTGYDAAVITDGVGVGDSRGLTLTSKADAAETWTTQVFVKFNELIPAGTQLRVAFDVKASEAAEIGTGCHGEPRSWQAGGIFGNISVSTEWLHVDTTFVVSEAQATGNGGNGLGSLAFDLNNDKEHAKTFYFDNFVCNKYKIGTTAKYAGNFVLLDFGFPTNISELVAKTGKSRLLFPKECVTVKYGEESFDILEVSGFADGRFYIFIDGEDAIADWLNEGDEVTVTFTNPTDEQYHLIYTDGLLKGQDVKDFDDVATAKEELINAEDAISYGLVRPTLVSADPEQGSFNLPNSIKEFKVTFDKLVQGDKLVAKLNNIELTVSPKEMAETFTLTREGDDLATGEYTITLTNIQPELTRAEGGDTLYTFGVGHVDVDPNDTVKTYVPLSYFEGCNDGGVPQGFKLYADGEPAELRQPGQSYSGGARVMTFAAGGDFTKGLYMRTWYCEYGTTTDYKLDFTAGKTYNISFNAANWTTGTTRYLNFQIFKESDLENAVFSQVVNCAPALNEKKDAVKGSTKTKIAFVPEETTNYVMRWVVASDANGTATNNTWQNGVILANVEVSYMPNVPGMASILLLNEALANAKKVQEGNTAERYAGEAFTTLSEAITKYETEGQAYTRPTDYETAAAALDAAAATMQDHHILCDNYDAAVKKAIDVVRQNEMPNGDPEQATKFTKTEKFADLKASVEKYHGASEWKRDTTVTWNKETLQNDSVLGDWYLTYTYDVLTVDAELTPAIAELQAIGNETAAIFTEGVSAVGGANGGKATGVAVLIDRLRLGGETLKALNVNDSTLLVAVNNALTDDDELAEQVKTAIKLALYDTLTVDADFLKPTVTIDEVTLEETTTPKSIDMTVFVKNPNVYVTTGTNYSAETVPGWVVPEGFSAPGLTTGWNDPRNGVDAPVDCMFQTWGGAYRIEQKIEDLPAGIYSLHMAYGERIDDGNLDDSFAYAATSDSITVETETTIDEATLEEVTKTTTIIKFAKAQAKVIGQSFPFATGSGAGALTIDSLVVTDGTLIFGVNAPSNSHTFFNEVRLSMIGAAAGFDYKKAADDIKQEIIEGIEPQAAQAKVRALQLFDLNGRRITTARPGIVIVKKLMNDGSVRIEKVVKK